MNIEDLATKQDILELKNALLEVLGKHENDTQKTWLKSKEVRELLNISSGTLQNMRVKKLLNPTKIEGVYYYRLSEIQALLSAGSER